MPPVNSQDTQLDPNFWRSLKDLSGSEEFQGYLEGKSPEEALDELSGVSRRRFMQLMGASITLAGLAGCRWEEETILTYNQRPEGMKPGEFRHFATAMELGGTAQPLLVTSFDGRPTKVEGHPGHPASQGAASMFAQASMLGLCDPDRAKKVHEGEEERSWKAFSETIFDLVRAKRATRGAGMAVIAPQSSSPTWQRLKRRFQTEFPQATWVEHEAGARENERAGSKMAFGADSTLRTRYHLENVKRLFVLEADLFGSHPDAQVHARGFSKRREPGDGLIRTYVAESTLSTTGAVADHRLPIRPSQAFHLLSLVDGALKALAGGSQPSVSASDAGGEDNAKMVVELAKDLHAARGESLVAVGTAMPAEVHALAHRVNRDLQAVGKTVSYVADELDATATSGIAAATAAMNEGKIDLAFILGVNPVYDGPADADFGAAMGKVAATVHAGLYRDETGKKAKWHLPVSHYLEAWGDSRTSDGTISIAQPLIDPLYDTRSLTEILATIFVDEDAKGLDLVKETHGNLDDRAWNRAVHDAMIADSAHTTVTPNYTEQVIGSPAGATSLGTASDGTNFELNFRLDESVYDGRFANNGWLQEVPDFITKVTWDNALMMSVQDAEAMGIETGDMVDLTVRSLKLPKLAVYVLAGQAKGTLTLPLGYGREEGGVVAGSREAQVQEVGFNAYKVRLTDAPWNVGGVTLRKVSGSYPFAMTQEHHLIDDIGRSGREDRVDQLVRQQSLEEWEKDPDAAKTKVYHPELVSQWEEHVYTGRKWGMAIDLNKCVGCNACIIACQSENNIPVVGKDQVMVGREMHWLRLDRYLIGDSTNPRVDAQPVGCMQCELAPCEQVCPVAATVHDEEGLNTMAYNRCIGTRYCANNCPYKVRRFNYFSNQLHLDEPENEVLKMAYNPDVSARSRGVMEKCTYCTQRIQAAKSAARVEKRKIADGEIQTACQQTCPAEAIVFGDLNHEGSAVSEAHEDPRAYAMLGELNIKPRTLYLAMVRNPNPALS